MDPKTMWGAGDYPAVAELISDVGELCVEQAGIGAGMDVLDVACGSGNATIPAARAGANVTGLDFQPDLLANARQRAQDEGIDVEWIEADAQQMPFDDQRFDRVISTFGHMFAPDHARTASEMRRVLRPDGQIVICCWTPEGSIGRMFLTIGTLVPPPPGGQMPLLWGTEAHVQKLLGPATFDRREVEWTHESVDSYADFFLSSFGPMLNAAEALGERSGELRKEFLAFLADENLADDGSLLFRGEYLVSVVDTPGAQSAQTSTPS